MSGAEAGLPGMNALRRWLNESHYGLQREFFGAFAVTLYLLEQHVQRRPPGDPWGETTRQARRAWDLVLQGWQSA